MNNGIEIVYDYAVHKDPTPVQPTGWQWVKDAAFSILIDSLGLIFIGGISLIVFI